MYVNKILFLSTSCSLSSDFSVAAVIWKTLLALKARTYLSPERSLCSPLSSSSTVSLNQGSKNLAFSSCRVCIASAELTTKIQECLVSTGARYPRPPNVTADDKARFPASCPTALAGAQQELEAKRPIKLHKAFQEELFAQKVLAWPCTNSDLVLRQIIHAISVPSCEYEIKFPNQEIHFETQFLPSNNCSHASHLSH